MTATATGVRTALYRLFDASDVLLYAGISSDPLTRQRVHSKREWWPDVAKTTLVWFPDLQAAEEAEKLAVQTEHPLHNRAYRVPSGDHAGRCERIAELRDQLDDAEAKRKNVRRQLLAEIAAACQGAGQGVTQEVAQYARFSPGYIQRIRDGRIT